MQTACIKLGRSWHDSLTGTASLRSILYCVGVLLKDVDAARRFIKKRFSIQKEPQADKL